jgi:putative Holliday junction resolvase
MRVVGVDYGRKRIGLAMSDASGTLARPWETLAAGASPAASAVVVATRLAAFDRETLGAEPVAAIVVGLPRRLNGTDNDQTAATRAFAAALADRTALGVHLQDERLTSHEADLRLRERERDWRQRKAKLDAAAAAIILQDYLDAARDAAPADETRPT